MHKERQWILRCISALAICSFVGLPLSAARSQPVVDPIPLLMRNTPVALEPGLPVISGVRHSAQSIKDIEAKAAALPTPENALATAAVEGGAATTNAPLGGCASNSDQPAPIVALASSLKCDWKLILEWVYFNIEYDPTYGSGKGPLGTLLDRRGNDADQVVLAGAMLRAAGIPQVEIGYQALELQFSGEQLSNWLGAPNDTNALLDLLTQAGIPHNPPTITQDGTIASITFLQFGIAKKIGDTWVFSLPSIKTFESTTSSNSLAEIVGYDKASFMAEAGGSFNAYSISNINRPALRQTLQGYASKLMSYLSSSTIYTTGQIIGGRKVTGPFEYYFPSNPNPSAAFPQDGSSNCPLQVSASSCMWSISITMPGASSAQAIVLNTADIYGKRITITSTPNGSGYVPTLLIDGVAPACASPSVGTCTNVGTVAMSGSWSIPASLTESNQFIGDATCPTSSPTACKTLNVGVGGSYLLSLGIGRVGRGMAEYHRQLLASAQAIGNSPSSDRVLGEALAVIGYNWLAETSAQSLLAERMMRVTSIHHFSLGIVGQANIQQLGYTGPYVDLPINSLSVVNWDSSGTEVTIPTPTGPQHYRTSMLANFFTATQSGSSFEASVLTQTQTSVANMTAASTVVLIDANANSSYSGATSITYFADGTTVAGRQYYASSILPQIQGAYSASDINAISAAVNAGDMVLLPGNGQLFVGLWKGAGYSTIHFGDTSIGMTQRISGGMSGGFSGSNIPTFDLVTNNTSSLPISSNTNQETSLFNSLPSPTNSFWADPVDSVTGAYVYPHTDLTIGSGSFPHALSFSRTYSSASGTNKTSPTANKGLGNGWNHNWSRSIALASDPYVGMGVDTAPAMPSATSLVAMYVMQDLQAGVPTVQTLTLATMVAKWFTDQLTNNAAQVIGDGSSEQFVAQPRSDGAASFEYMALPGSTARLTKTATGFRYVSKVGDTQTFGLADPSAAQPLGLLQNWTFPFGVSIDVSYNADSHVSRVKNSLGRSFSLTYDGDNDLISVADDAGRVTKYIYDGSKNLNGFVDPRGNRTAYEYDTSGAYDTDGHLTQVYYPSTPGAFVTNWYDAMGRVRRQANGSGITSDLYLAGSRSEIVDGLGNAQVTYLNENGGVIQKTDVLNPAYGTVMLGASTIPGWINVTTNSYDGLNRLVSSTMPEGGVNSYTYDRSQNPWANNVASVTQTPKSGSQLSARTTSYRYDPVWNKPNQIMDPLGLVATTQYDPVTGLPRVQVQDAGGGTHFNARSSLTYNEFGLPVRVTNPVGAATTFSYDAKGNVVSTTLDADRLALTSTYAYDAVGNQISAKDARGGRSTASYDASRNPVRAVDPMGMVTLRTYDADDKLLTISAGSDAAPVRQLTNSYTRTGKIETTADANGNVTRYAYDAADRLVLATDAVGRATRMTYDAIGRKASIGNSAIQAAPLGAWAYTPDGAVSSFTNANNRVTGYTLDGFDRISRTTYPGGSWTESTYDNNNNLLTFQTRKGDTLSYQYNTLNRLTQKAGPSLSTVTYTYDLLGRLTSASDNSSAISMATTGGTLSTTAFQYDAANRLMGTTFGPVQAQAPPTAASVNFSLGYDATNRRISQSTNDTTWWDAPAAASSTVYVANALDQYTSVGSITPTYNGNGNLTSDGTFTLGYDAENRLISASSPGLSASYSYDPLGRRKSKTVNGATTIYVQDPQSRALLDYDGATGGVVTWYGFGQGPNEVQAQMNAAGTSRLSLIPDVLGSVVATLNAGTGTLTKAGFQTFGESVSTAGTFRYTGARIDPETNGLYDFRARMYSPRLGRFLQTDPIGMEGGVNLYAYVLNDPLNLVDPSGRQAAMTLCVAGPVGCGVGAGVTIAQALIGGATIAAILSLSGDAQISDPVFIKPPANAWDPSGPKAPGYPGAQDTGHPDYQDPKGGPNWVPTPNGAGYGWQDKRGNVWVPTGPDLPGNNAHGGPHWDVQNPKNGDDYENKFPPIAGSSAFSAFDYSSFPSTTSTTPSFQSLGFGGLRK